MSGSRWSAGPTNGRMRWRWPRPVRRWTPRPPIWTVTSRGTPLRAGRRPQPRSTPASPASPRSSPPAPERRRARHTRPVVLSRRWSAFLVLVGVWTWLIWPRFGLAIWRDDRSFADGSPTAFLGVHALLIGASLV